MYFRISIIYNIIDTVNLIISKRGHLFMQKKIILSTVLVALLYTGTYIPVYANKDSSEIQIEEKVVVEEQEITDAQEVISEKAFYGVITGDCVNFRREPSINAEIIGQLHKGYVVTYRDAEEADGYIWRHVEYDGIWGWVVDDYVKAEEG